MGEGSHAYFIRPVQSCKISQRRFHMISRLQLYVGALAVTLLFVLSCSGGSSPQGSSPVTPEVTSQAATDISGHQLLAFYLMQVDPDAENMIEMIPVREAEFHLNILRFVEKAPCTDCFKIVGLSPTVNGTFEVDIQITHPLPVQDYTVFDVRGIMMFPGTHVFDATGDDLYTSDITEGEGALVNADGFTKHFNFSTYGNGPGGLFGYEQGKFGTPTFPNCTLNGYKRHITAGSQNTRNALYVGSAVTATYELKFPDGPFIFGYAVDANWAEPTVIPVENPNEDFPADANSLEPWKIDVTYEAVGQGLTDAGGTAKLWIDVYDHQGKDSYWQPTVECYELYDGTATAVWDSDDEGFSTWVATIENEKIVAQGDYMCLIAITDKEEDIYYDLTAFQIIDLTVAEFQIQGNEPPTAAASADNYEPAVNQLVQFTDESTDPDGYEDILYWEWDFSYNPVDGFNPGAFDPNPQIQYPLAGVYKVQLRVTDSDDNFDFLDTPLTITVGGGSGGVPIACAGADNLHPNVGNLIHFYDCSIDPDGPGDIWYFEWDLNGDGIYEIFIKDTTKIYYEGGDYEVQHRVTDQASNVDTLDVPLLIEVNGPPEAAAEADQYSVTMGEIVTLTNISTDPDGNGAIEHVYWDMDGNGDYDDPVDIDDQDTVFHSFYTGGTHYIGLKVVDEWGLEDELDIMLEIYVDPFEPFCVRLIDQYNSADSLYQTRSFDYYNNVITGVSGLDYKATNGPWDFTVVPPSTPAVCRWLAPGHPDIPSAASSLWPDADFFFEEDDPGGGNTQWVAHRFDFTDAENGDLKMQGQFAETIMGDVTFNFDETFYITHPICLPWYDSGSGTGNFYGVNFAIDWDMQALGTGPAIFMVNGEQTVLNCMLIRHHMTFNDTDIGVLTFHLLSYQWIDEEGNEVAFMQAENGLEGNNFSGNTYTGTVIVRSMRGIS